MRKNVLFVIDSLNCGGAEKSLVSLLPLLNCEKYDIHLWMLHRGGVFESLVPDNVAIEPEPRYTPFDRLKLRLALMLYSLVYRIKRMKSIKEHGAETLWKCAGWAYQVPSQQFDVAIAYQQGLPTYLVAKCIKAKKKMAWVNVNIFNAGYHADFNARFYEKLDRIVPVSQDMENILRENYPQFNNKYVCVYDILNPQIIRHNAEDNLKELGLFDKHPIFVTVGRLVPQKNYLLAVETAKVLNEKGVDFRWFFVGEGSERPQIEHQILQYGLNDKVFLLGMQTNPYPFMAHCDIYVQTSSFEGFGLTIAEAKILGKPVVSTNFDVVHDQITHEQNGLIAEMTAEALADNILRLLKEDSLRIRIVDNVRKEHNITYLTEVKKVEQLLDAD